MSLKWEKVTERDVIKSVKHLVDGCYHKNWHHRLDLLFMKYEKYKAYKNYQKKGKP